MRIAINVEQAYDNVTGIGVYVAQMVTHLVEAADKGEYTLFTSSTYRNAKGLILDGKGRFSRRCLPLSHKVCQGAWLATGWPDVSRYIGPHDIYHSMTASPFPATGGRCLVTVHDLSWVVRPELYQRRHRYVWLISQWRMLRQADHYVAVSEWTKRDMMEHLRLPSERITVIPEAARPCFRPMEQATVQGVLTKYQLREPYFLVVGEMNLRKNHVRLVRAFAQVLARGREPGQLVFCGPAGYGADRTVHEVRSLKLMDWVRFLGYLPDEELVGLVNGACGVVFTSIHEGFGLPILEAMACGTPVITSSVTSMPEVAGDAALLVDPTSETAIMEAMSELLKDEGSRKQLSDQGLKRAKRFSWQESARRLLGLYESLVG